MTTVDHATGEMTGDPASLGPLDRYGPLDEIDAHQAAMIMVRVQRLRRDQAREVLARRKEAARLRAVAVKARARGQLEPETGTVEDRKARGRLDSADAFYDVECAEAVADAALTELFLLRDDWETCRSIGANERAKASATEGFGA